MLPACILLTAAYFVCLLRMLTSYAYFVEASKSASQPAAVRPNWLQPQPYEKILIS